MSRISTTTSVPKDLGVLRSPLLPSPPACKRREAGEISIKPLFGESEVLEQSWIWAFYACTLSAVTAEIGGPIPQAHHPATPAEGMRLSIIERPTSKNSVGATKEYSPLQSLASTHVHACACLLPQVHTHIHAHRRQDKVWREAVPFLTEVRKVL